MTGALTRPGDASGPGSGPGRAERRGPAAPVAAGPLAEAKLRYGYTLKDLARLAQHAANRKLHAYGTDPATCYELAFAAVAEHLYASGERPAPPDLVHAALAAIGAHDRARRQFHGLAPAAGGTRPGFERYWHTASAHHGGPEEAVTDRIALSQIWPRLTRADREAFTALAGCGDYRAAATALGISHAAFRARICDARRRFLALWHDGETPSRPWIRDRRSAPGQRPATGFLRNRRYRAAATQAAKITA